MNDYESLKERIEELKNTRSQMIAQRDQLTKEIFGLEGAILELARLLAGMKPPRKDDEL